jgi:alkanesulfonate monooxygenase SsuD/methylene tetrahydromethanopterin reductase-like flavin-dependent oxidoreductase (luciferase family)
VRWFEYPTKPITFIVKSMPERPNVHLAVALDGAGWHPAAWRDERARPAELFSPSYWVDLTREAERGLVDFVTFDDSLSLQWLRRGVPDDRTDQVRGRLDAVMVAARVAPATTSVGLVPVVTTTHVEPFHASKAIATLDYVSHGRAGFQARISGTGLEARLFGRREIQDRSDADRAAGVATAQVSDLFDEAADFVEVVRRLWDSWEDDAEVRDVATGRFVDRDKLHYIDFEGRWFSVKGPSITPRPPQGQPLVTVLAHVPVAFALAARRADVVFVTPDTTARAGELVATIRDAERAVGRDGLPLRVFADLVAFLDDDAESAEKRKAHLDELFGKPYRSDALVFVGTPAGLADLLVEWQAAGVEGFRLRPGALPHDLEAVTRGLSPLLSDRGVFRHRYHEADLAARLGLPRPLNRYVSA